MNYGSEAEIRIGVAEMVKSPALVSVSDAAQQFMHIVNPSGSMGTWSAELTPYLIEPMNLLRSRLYEAIVMVGPARSGKTLAMIEGSIAYSIACDPADTLIVQSNQSQAEDYSKTRIARMIAGSPELAKRLSPRAHEDNVLLKFFRSGMALRFGWPSLAQLSGKDIRRVLMTDVDNFTGDLKVDEAFGLALKRTQTYMSAGMLVAESSPAKDHDKPGWRPATPHEAPPADGILALYNRGDRRRWYWPCPHCREYFEAAPGLSLFRLPDLEQLVEMVRETAVEALVDRWSEIFCPHCAAGIDFGHRKAMNARGRWVGEGQKAHADGTVTGERLRSRVASFWMGGVAAAYQKWDSLIERYLQAVKHYANTGEQQALKSTVNVDQAMPFVPVAGSATAALKESWSSGASSAGSTPVAGSAPGSTPARRWSSSERNFEAIQRAR